MTANFTVLDQELVDEDGPYRLVHVHYLNRCDCGSVETRRFLRMLLSHAEGSVIVYHYVSGESVPESVEIFGSKSVPKRKQKHKTHYQHGS